MKSYLLVVIPLVGALLALVWPRERERPWLLPAVGVLHAILSLWLLVAPPSVNRAAGPGSPVTQEIAVTVDANNVSCAINGEVVATYPKTEVVTAGKLKSTDGVYGIRFAHNTEATVTGLAVTKN